VSDRSDQKKGGDKDMGAVPKPKQENAEKLLKRAAEIFHRTPLPPLEHREAEAARLEKYLNEMDKRRGPGQTETDR